MESTSAFENKETAADSGDVSSMIEMKTLSGRIFKFFYSCGLYFPVEMLQFYDPRPILPNLPQMKARNDDIFVCGFMRSGTNWTWEIVNMLVQGETHYQKDRKNATILEFQPLDNLDEMMSPRILSSHLPFRYMPKDAINKRCKFVYVQRNPKDVMLSHFKFRNSELNVDASWEEHFDLFSNIPEDHLTSWFGTTKSWEKAILEHLPILLIYYEDLKENTAREITKIAKFLDIQTTEKFVADVVEKVTFSNMKKAKIQMLSDTLQENPDLQNISINTVEKRSKYYRKGEVGDWKNYFTVTQSEQFDRIFSERMKDSKLTFKYSL